MHPHLTGDIETGFAPTESVKNQNLTNQRGGDFLLAVFQGPAFLVFIRLFFGQGGSWAWGKGKNGSPPAPRGGLCFWSSLLPPGPADPWIRTSLWLGSLCGRGGGAGGRGRSCTRAGVGRPPKEGRRGELYALELELS